MARILHRIFEIYESCEEASRALTPRSKKTVTESTTPDSWTFEQLAVSRTEGVTRVQFTEANDFNEATLARLNEQFALLADKLGRDSIVLVDFTGVALFDAPCIDALLLFSRKLRTKGSRLALCSLAPAVRASFFLRDDRD